MQKAELLILASQVVTPVSPGPKKGRAMDDLMIIEEGGVAVRDGRILDVGIGKELQASYKAEKVIDASGCVVTPGLVDAHTHVIFAGDRVDEFEMRLRGATYLEIMAAGGGIMSTVRRTRRASLEELVAQSRRRLDAMLASGSTTVEVKTGYGLDTETELKMMEAILLLDQEHPLDLVPTFLGAHAVPEEYKGHPEDYVDLVINEMLPALARWADEKGLEKKRIFCDVFCDEGAFSFEQSGKILRAAKDLGFSLKIHSDEFRALGATGLAVELGAASADHLACTPDSDVEKLAQSPTIAVLLPGTSFGLGHTHFADGRRFIEAGAALALGTDLNPGTCWCESMAFIMALACRYCGLTIQEALTAATLNAAYAIGMGEEVGSLERGKKADLVIWDVPDFRYLAYRFGVNPVKAVFKEAREVS